MNTIKPTNVLEFLRILGKLKTEKRTGWVNHKVNLPESISDHMYRMAMMSFLIEDPAISREKCMKISLVHDMAEALVGDITPFQGITKEEKHKLEMDAMTKIKDTVSGSVGQELYDLWNEYETSSSSEAKIVKELDKLEMIIQADEYESAQSVKLDQFFEATKGYFKNREVKEWADELIRERANKNSK